MKTRKWFVLAFGLFVLFLVFYLWIQKNPELFEVIRESDLVSEQVEKDSPSEPLSRREKIETLIGETNFPIHFIGEVVDEDRNAIPDAVVKCQVRRGVLSLGGGVKDSIYDQTVRSDISGRFLISNIRGYLLEISSITKDGFFMPAGQRMNFNQELIGESDKKFILVSDQNASTISFFEHRLSCGWDGIPISLSIRLGENEDDADLLFISNRIVEKSGRFSWSMEIRSIGGGILESLDKARSVAPVDGYQKNWLISYDHDEDGYLSSISRDFIIKTKENQFARLHLNVHADVKRPSVPSINCRVFINDSGGRLLDDRSGNSQY